MDQDTVILFTRNGLGDGPAALQLDLVIKFLTLTLAGENLPAKILFYTEGVAWHAADHRCSISSLNLKQKQPNWCFAKPV